MPASLTDAIAEMLKAYPANHGQGLHVRPYMNLDKARALAGHTKNWLGPDVNPHDIFLLVDDTFDGSATKGLAVTADRLVISTGDKFVGVFDVAGVTGTEVSGTLNKYLTVQFVGGQSLILQFGYLETDAANAVAEVIRKTAHLCRTHRAK